MDISQMDIQEVNRVLEQRREILLGRDGVNAQAAARDLNTLLGSIVDTVPDRINAVVLGGKIPHPGVRQEFTYWEDKQFLVDYLKKLQNVDNLPLSFMQRTFPFELVLHLPLSRQESYKELLWSETSPVELIVTLGRIRMPFSAVYKTFRATLKANEAKVKVAQVSDSEFSPHYQGRNTPLEPPYSALEHYLSHLKFIGYTGQPIPQDVLSKPGMEYMRNVLNVFLPFPAKGLVELKVGKLNGFAGFKSPDEFKIFEFQDLRVDDKIRQIPQHYRNDSRFIIAYLIDAYQRTPFSNIHVYSGNDAIARLHTARRSPSPLR